MSPSISRRQFIAASGIALGATRLSAVTRPLPSPSQLAWQRDELAMFLHFGVNTFTDREWGDGREDPSIFNPSKLDARQWARTARAGGFRAMVLTAKHHDGFCLWPTATTGHSVKASPWRNGEGDVVREFVEACRAEGLRPGLYLSPWDRNNPSYGDSPRYNDLYCEQLTELLTRYGALAEVWFDGANGEGPNGKRQQYDWPRVFALVRRLQPGAVMFSDAGPDVRWCGNENGIAGDPNWSTVDPGAVPYPGASGDTIAAALQHGDPAGTVWRPAEADTSIRPGWFYHPAEDDRVRTGEQLLRVYLASVGRNAKLLLNVPPTREGLVHDNDARELAAFDNRRRAMFGHDLAQGRKIAWRRTGARTAECLLDLGRSADLSGVRLEEDITRGQAIARYPIHGAVDGPWRELSRGTTVGYTRIDRFEPTAVRRLRLLIEDAVAPAQPVGIRAFGPG